MSLIQSLNKFLRDAIRKAELAVRKKQAQNERARTKGYDNNNNFRAKSASSNRNDTTFAYNAAIPKNKKVMIDDLDVISSQSVQKKQEVEDYEELDKNYNYEYFQISRRDGFCAILRIGVLNKSRSESLREKNKRIKANKKSSGSSKKDNYIAHIVVLTYGAVWEPEIETSEDEPKLVSLNFNEANFLKLFAPGLVGDLYTDGTPGSYTSVRFWEKSSVMANGIQGFGDDGVLNANTFYSYPNLYTGVCDFESIRSGLSSDTKFTVSGSSPPLLFTSTQYPYGSFSYYDSNYIGDYSDIASQISYGAPIAIDREQLNFAIYLSEEYSIFPPYNRIKRGSFDTSGSNLWPRGFSVQSDDGSKATNVGQSTTLLARILDGTSIIEYLADQDNSDPSLANSESGYTSNVFVLPQRSAEVQGEQLWLNHRSLLNQMTGGMTETNTLIWEGWNSPKRLFSVTDQNFQSQTYATKSISYAIEDNSKNIDDQKLCKWCVREETSGSGVIYKWMAGDLSDFKSNPLNSTIKTLQMPDTRIGDQYFVSDGTGNLGDTFYSDLTGGLLPLLRYAESSYTLSDETKLTVKLSKEGDLFLCKMNPDKFLSSSVFDPLANNGTVPKLIPFTSQNIADKIELPDTPFIAYKFVNDPVSFASMPLEIQTIPSFARSIATMYFNPKNSKLTASLGIVPLGVADLDLATDDSPITVDSINDVFFGSQYNFTANYYN